MRDGRATIAMLQELWRLLLVGLLEDIERPKRPSVELLQVARKFLRDNACGIPDEAARKDLEVLYRLYSKSLHEALTGPTPRAGVLAEARHWLVYHGIRADLPGAQVAAVAKKLGDLDLPFTTKH
jgi:hypothetical protein